jgi:hypothetical protein
VFGVSLRWQNRLLFIHFYEPAVPSREMMNEHKNICPEEEAKENDEK